MSISLILADHLHSRVEIQQAYCMQLQDRANSGVRSLTPPESLFRTFVPAALSPVYYRLWIRILELAKEREFRVPTRLFEWLVQVPLIHVHTYSFCLPNIAACDICDSYERSMEIEGVALNR